MTIISVVIGNFITLICLALLAKYFKNKLTDSKITLKIDEESKEFIDALGRSIAENLSKEPNKAA